MAGNLAGKTRIPKRIERLWRCLLAHNLNHLRPRDETGAWKSLQNCTGAKEMIAVAMRGVDRRQILSAGGNPIRQGRACSTVIGVSTRTASRSPEMRVDEIGGHGRCFSPGGKSLVMAGMLGAKNTSHLSEPF